jgi:hypothetical protein
VKFHTDPSDPKLGQPWMHRTGGCIVYNKRTGFGSYEIDALIPNNLGCAYALWTFFFTMNCIHLTPVIMIFNEGLHQQGSLNDGYYLTRNHEIDIEFPSAFRWWYFITAQS